MTKIKELSETFEVFEKLSKMGDKVNIKIKLLKQHKNNEVLKWMIKQTYDKQITFGIKPKPIKKSNKEYKPIQGYKNYLEFKDLLVNLANRALSGNKAASTITNTLKTYTRPEQDCYMRVLGRDLGVGLNAKTINKAFPNLIFRIPMFKGNKITDKRKAEIQYPVWCEFKADGFRMQFLIKNGKGIAYSPGGIDFSKRLGHILKPFCSGPDSYWESEMIADWIEGDEYEYESQWGKTATLLRTGYSAKQGWMKKDLGDDFNRALKNELFCRVFDRTEFDSFNSGIDKTPWKARDFKKRRWIRKFNNPQIKFFKGKLCNSWKEIEEYFDLALSFGYEGLMIKKINGIWQGKKTDDMLKKKNEDTEEYEIVGYKEGKKNFKGMLGSFIFKDKEGNLVHCGIGYKLKQRKEFWKDKEKYINEKWWIEMVYQKDPNQVAKSRFASFKRLRPPDDKSL